MATQNNDSTHLFRQTTSAERRPISVPDRAAYAEITFPDSSVQRRELYYGSGYLSQSSSHLYLPSNATEVTVYTYGGRSQAVEGVPSAK